MRTRRRAIIACFCLFFGMGAPAPQSHAQQAPAQQAPAQQAPAQQAPAQQDDVQQSSAPSLQAFNAAVAAAYQPMQIAAGYLRTGNSMPASLELESALAAWGKRVAPFADAPPPIFAADAAFAQDIRDLGAALAKAEDAARTGDAPAGRAATIAVRAGLSALRQRNGIYLFPDCVLALSRAMDGLWVYRDSPPDFEVRAQVVDAARLVGVLGDTVARCDRLADAGLRARPKYQRLMGDMRASLEPLRDSVADGDLVRFINVLREQRSLERLIAMELG